MVWNVEFKKTKGKTRYLRGNIRALKDDSCRLVLKYQLNGQWREISTTYHEPSGKKLTQEAAEKALKEWRDFEEKRATEQGSKMLLSEYLSTYIEDRIDEDEIERSTAAGYRRIVKNHIIPYLGNVRLCDLTQKTVKAWVKTLAGKYAKTTVKKAYIILKAALEEATLGDEPLLPRNIAKGVKIPKCKDDKEREAKGEPLSYKPNSLDERNRFKLRSYIDIEPEAPLNLAYALALKCGLRRGEICGLRWKNVNFNANTVYIGEAIGTDPDHPEGASLTYVKSTKSTSSERNVPVPADLLEALRRRQIQLKEDRFTLGYGGKTDELYVCGDAEGKPLNNHWLTTRWRQTAEVLDLIGTNGNRPTLHDLRHTYATVHANDGTAQASLAELMGHSSIKVTDRYYIGISNEANMRAVNNVEAKEAERMSRHAHDGEILNLSTGTDGR